MNPVIQYEHSMIFVVVRSCGERILHHRKAIHSFAIREKYYIATELVTRWQKHPETD